MRDGLWNTIIFWSVWLLIPTLFDFVIGIYRAVRIGFKHNKNKQKEKNKLIVELSYEPFVSIIIPVFNSERTLEKCVESIINQSYSINNIEIILVDNGSSDDSYEIFQMLQSKYSKLHIWWYKSGKGKARALNTGLFYARGKYIVNIDSDGYINKDCIKSFVIKFEENKDISAMTGSVIIDKDEIINGKGIFKKLINKCEFVEYLEIFLIGRNNQSLNNGVFTVAGAVSAMRQEVAAKSQMYNVSTLGEDAHMTQQIIRIQGGRVDYCKEAMFFTDPIESLDRLCIQRQRWQRGALEVAGMFKDKGKRKNKVLIKMLISDHAMTFPKLIWMFAMIYLVFIGYPLKMVIIANIIIYLIYCLLSFISILVVYSLLSEANQVKKFTIRNFWIFMFMPIYRTIIGLFRIGGIINSLSEESDWNPRGFKEEFKLGIRAIFNLKDGK